MFHWKKLSKITKYKVALSEEVLLKLTKKKLIQILKKWKNISKRISLKKKMIIY